LCFEKNSFVALLKVSIAAAIADHRRLLASFPWEVGRWSWPALSGSYLDFCLAETRLIIEQRP
jgi:hypothetical protein